MTTTNHIASLTAEQLEDFLALNGWESATYESLVRMGDSHEEALYGVEISLANNLDRLKRI
tara:strand:- start:23 stop:205 length:183 start_codon:yes stop_codon:yes gene_type:complete